MSSIVVRPFRRSDRDQLTQLVNTHAGAVVPGMSVSVSTVLAALERQPGEFIEDPWVSERMTLVAEQRDRIAAAAHLLRYFPDERAGTGGAGRRRDSLVVVLARGSRRESLLAGCDGGSGCADGCLYPAAGGLGCHEPARGR